jgi:hypothetical protein
MSKCAFVVVAAAMTGLALVAAEPVWPADFDQQVATCQAAWVPSGTTVEKSCSTAFDARLWMELAAETPVAMDARYRTWDFLDALIMLDTFPYAGLRVFLR